MTERQRVFRGLAAAASILAVSAGLAAASGADLISGEVAARGCMVMIGLVTLIGSANLTPKTARSTAPTAHQQNAMRFYGWAMTFAGIAWVVLWTFAPIGLAMIAAPAGVASVLVVWIAICARGNGKSDDVAPRM